MKKYLALLLFALITTVSFGQSNYKDVVYLKNGSIIRGTIIEQVPNESIKIETADRSVFVYQMDEIEKLKKKAIQGKSGGSHSNSGLQSGYKGIVELGNEINIGDYGIDRLKLNIIYGYQINPYFYLGFGTGFRFYHDDDAFLLPVFLDFRANFINNKISPYFSLDAGYSFNGKREFDGFGLLLNPTLGVSFKVSDKSAMNVGLGYEKQYEMRKIDVANLKGIGINVGISF